MWVNAQLLRFYPGLSVEALAQMDDSTRWLFHRFIESIRAKELWDQHKLLSSIRAEKDARRDYLCGLFELAFWNDPEAMAEHIEAASRI